MGRRMKTYGPKALIDLGNGYNVLNWQLKLLKETCPHADFITVLGFDAHKIYKYIPDYVRVLDNPWYEETNIVKTLSIALRATITPRVVIVYGDLVFNRWTLGGFPPGFSYVISDNNNRMRNSEVGLTVVAEGNVTRFAYGLPIKWTQIVHLQGEELQMFRQLCYNEINHKLFTFEILNTILDKGGHIINTCPYPSNMNIIEIDSSKDIDAARDMLKECE